MWIKLLSGIIIFGTHLKRYDRSFGYYRRFEHFLMFNTDFCTTMLIIKSHIEYYCVVWGNSCNSNAFKIEKLQRRACKLILGNYYTTQDAVRKQFSILSFEETVFIHKAKVMYEIANNTAPRTSDSLNEGLPIKMVRKKFQRKINFLYEKDSRFNSRIIGKCVYLIGQVPFKNMG